MTECRLSCTTTISTKRNEEKMRQNMNKEGRNKREDINAQGRKFNL